MTAHSQLLQITGPLTDMRKPQPRPAEIGVMIGLFFLEQKGGDYAATRQFLRDLNITDIWETDRKIYIQTARPGLLIGAKGANISGLEKALGKPVGVEESFCWADIITPVDWAEEARSNYTRNN